MRAALLLAAAVVLFLWPVLVEGRVLSTATTLYDVAPWQASATPDISSYHNGVINDPTQTYYPWSVFARAALRQGHLPTWNPYALAGTPFLGNAQTALFSPFSLPLWLLPLSYALGLAAALKLWMAAFGTYLLARELDLGFWPAIAAALIFCFGAFNVVWLSFPLSNVSVMLPWALWMCERILARARPRDALWLAVILACAVAGGQPETALHVVLVVAVYGAISLALGARRAPRKQLARLGLLAGGGVLGAGLAAIAWVPPSQEVSGSLGLLIHQGGGYPLPVSAARTLLFPDWWGRPTGASVAAPVAGNTVYNERTLYSGAVALVLATASLLSPWAWRRKLPFALITLLALAVIFHLGPFARLLAGVPPFGHALNQRLILAVNLGVALLAAFGLAQLQADRAFARRAMAASLAVLALCVLAIVAMGPTLHEVGTTLDHLRLGTDFLQPHVIALTSVAWAIALAGGLLLIVLLRDRLGRTATAVLVVALVAVDAGHFAHGYNPMPPRSRVYSFTPASLGYLRAHRGQGRVTALGFALQPDTGMFYGLSDIRGYDPPKPTTRYFNLFRIASPEQADWGLRIPAVTVRARRVLDLLSVRYVLQAPDAPPVREPAMPVVYHGADAVIYDNEQAVPRAYVPTSVLPVSGESEALSALVAPGFRPGSDAVVEAAAPPATGTVRIVSSADTKVVLGARLARGGLVVLNDAWANGWHATVDGRAARTLPVNSIVRGAIVPAGTHTLTWSYDAPGLELGALLTLASLLAIGALALAAGRPALAGRARHAAGRLPGRRARDAAGLLDAYLATEAEKLRERAG